MTCGLRGRSSWVIPAGVLIADETGFLKKGTKSAGVQRRYSGYRWPGSRTCQLRGCSWLLPPRRAGR